ncbi:hypothetical protein [Legionella sainthelensi]|nr:hypothetical protein [Legionella sainthelensi]
MYYLRSKNNSKITENIFNKLNLKEEQKGLLSNLLDKKPHQEFTPKEIQTVIEPNLGRALRELTSEFKKNEFLTTPESSSLFSSAGYFMEFCLKQEAVNKYTEIADLIYNQFDKMEESEIFQVPNIKNAMQNFAKEMLPEIINEFQIQWSESYKLLKQQKIVLNDSVIVHHKTIVLNKFIQEKTMEFFIMNQNKHLDLYIKHLKTDFVWGSLEDLTNLHRAIQGEHAEYNKNGAVDIFYDVEINLQIYSNDTNIQQETSIADIIINNQDNTHWVSIIPDNVFQPPAVITKQSDQPPKSKDNPVTSYKKELTKQMVEYEDTELKNIIDLCEGKPYF